MKAITLEQFTSTIFTQRNADEHILYFAHGPGGHVSYPIDEAALKKATSARTNKPMAAYFGTATMRVGPEGRMYNRQALFEGLYCLVLDDIGTKCMAQDLPEEMRECPSWVIESSPGNFQYGYLLAEPIREVGMARAFVDLMYKAGKWDSGGAMPNKAVRLPVGYNTKDKYLSAEAVAAGPKKKDYWQVKATVWAPDNLWTPEELLAAAGAAVSWQDLEEDLTGALQRDPKRSRGAAAWLQPDGKYCTAGITDEVLKWLDERGEIVNEGPEWWDILCPFRADHSEGTGQTAGYSPLGRGPSPELRGRRRFHCFHDSCEGNHATEFVRWVADTGGPEVPVSDPTGGLLNIWALDVSRAEWINLRTGRRVSDANFKAGHQQKLSVMGFTPDGTPRVYRIPVYRLLAESSRLMRLDGSRYLPGEEIFFRADDELLNNACRIPHYAGRAYQVADFQPVLEFMQYLLPGRDGADYEWFISHLAAKARDPLYRGNGVVMSTPTAGTGRGTMVKILDALWGVENVQEPSMSALVKGISGEGFNEFLESMWAVVPEAKEAGELSGGHYADGRRYQALKQFCDPFPVKTIINRKYGGKSTEVCHTSVVICSNYADALGLDTQDRRFLIMDNPMVAWSRAKFGELHQYLNAGAWREPFWNWLLERDLSEFVAGDNLAMASAEESEGRYVQTLRSMTTVGQVVELMLRCCEENYRGLCCRGDLVAAVIGGQLELRLQGHRALEHVTGNELNKRLRSLPYKMQRSYTIKWEGGRRKTFSMVVGEAGAELEKLNKKGRLSPGQVREWYQECNVQNLRDYAVKYLQEYEL